MWFQGVPYGRVPPNFGSCSHRWIRLGCRAAFSRASRRITDPRNSGALESFRGQQGALFPGQPADVVGNHHAATAVATSLCEANADTQTYARLRLNYFFAIS